MPNFVSLGNSGLKVSPISLGTMNFGNEQWGCEEPTSAKIIDAYLGAGHNFITTAHGTSVPPPQADDRRRPSSSICACILGANRSLA